MNKNDMIRYVSKKTNFTQENAKIAIDAVYEGIAEALKNDKKLIIHGVGTFENVERAARMGRNPKTGEPLPIPATHTIRFKVAKEIKSYINEK